MIGDGELNKLSDDQLIDLNHRICAKIEARVRQRRKKALAEFEVGDAVYFEDLEGNRIEGFVLRVNQKSLTIRTERMGIWRIPPGVVKKAKVAEISAGRLLDLSRPNRQRPS